MICQFCKKEFLPDKFHPNQKYCSKECYKLSNDWKKVQNRHNSKQDRKDYLKKYKQSEKYKTQQKEYRKNNEKAIEYQKQYEKEVRNKSEKRISYMKKYRKQKQIEKNKNKILIYKNCETCNKKFQIHNSRQKFCSKNCQAIAYRKSEKYLELMKEYQKQRRNKDINFKILGQLRHRINITVKNNSKSDKTEKLLGCTVSELKNHLEKQFKHGMSWNNYSIRGWHIDHIKPCASFDLTDPKQQKECFHYSNLQPLWWRENLSKGAKQ